jgi:Cof subfamily protein (haloacid dehalogenase superfamily)
MNNRLTDSYNGLFVTDFDGTLLRSDGTFSAEDLGALESLSRRGIKTAIATGRSLYSFDRSPGANLPVDYIIFSSGAGVVEQSSRKLLYEKNLSTEMVTAAVAFMQAAKFDFMLHRPVPDNHRYEYLRLNGSNSDFDTRIKRYREFGTPLNSRTEGDIGEACQLIAVIPQQQAEHALKSAYAGLPGLSVIRATSPLDQQSTWIEVFHPEVSKSQTAAWLASGLGVATEDSMAIGNDYNDWDLLEWAGRSFVVGNAPDDLKSRFTTVVSNDHGGVAEAISRWLEK